MTRRSSTRTQRPSRGGSSFVALLALGLIVVVAVGLSLLVMGTRREQASPAPKDEVQRPDPFADLPPDVPKRRPARAASSDASDPFRGISVPTDDAIWREASDYAARADILIAEAVAAKDDGARELALQKGHEAQALLDRALQTANPWLAALEEERGREDPIVKAADAETRRWVQELVVLKKVAGL